MSSPLASAPSLNIVVCVFSLLGTESFLKILWKEHFILFLYQSSFTISCTMRLKSLLVFKETNISAVSQISYCRSSSVIWKNLYYHMIYHIAARTPPLISVFMTLTLTLGYLQFKENQHWICWMTLIINGVVIMYQLLCSTIPVTYWSHSVQYHCTVLGVIFQWSVCSEVKMKKLKCRFLEKSDVKCNTAIYWVYSCKICCWNVNMELVWLFWM